jgi:phosphatidylglycerol:prolipoprotein diacylglycerol transferase
MHPVLIQWGALKLATYGVFVALGYLAGILWLQSRRREMGLDETKFWRLIYCVFFGAIVGGKLMFWAVSYREILSGRIGLLSDLRYGFVFFGGVLGSVATAWAAKSWLGFEFLALADYFSVALPLGHAVGRLGCLAAGCCYGRPTSLPWGVVLGGNLASSTPVELWGVPLHPVQLYESLANICIWGFLLFGLLPKVKDRRFGTGTVFFFYTILYGLARFVVEFFRYDDRGFSVYPFSISQWISLAAIVLAGSFLIKRGIKAR